MTLDEFIKVVKEELIKFEKDWKQGVIDTPQHFPLDLPEGEWWEQLQTS